MAKPGRPEKKKKKRDGPHMTVTDLPNGGREVTVDGHTWVEGPPPPAPPAEPDDDAAPDRGSSEATER